VLFSRGEAAGKRVGLEARIEREHTKEESTTRKDKTRWGAAGGFGGRDPEVQKKDLVHSFGDGRTKSEPYEGEYSSRKDHWDKGTSHLIGDLGGRRKRRGFYK